MNQTPKLLVVSQTFPPLVAGTPILLTNLLRAYPGHIQALAGYSHYEKEDASFAPPCPTVYLRPPRVRLFEIAYDRLVATTYPCVYYWIKRQIKKLKPDVILGAFPGPHFFVSAFRAACEFHIPFYAHMHDLWEENYEANDFLNRAELANCWEKTILTQSRRVLCMTEHQQKFYFEKHRIRTQLLPHTIPPDHLENAPGEMIPVSNLNKRIVLFTGNVSSHMNLDALRVLVRASEMLPENVELLFCTNVPPSTLSQLGIASSRLRVTWLPREALRATQSTAHVLVAPLSHTNNSASEVRTVFSTKLLEYMVSGRPILIFAPADSYHSCSARRGNWAHVVNQNNPRALAEGIKRLIKHPDLSHQMVSGALMEARRRDARIHARRLYEWVLEDSNHSVNQGSSGQSSLTH